MIHLHVIQASWKLMLNVQVLFNFYKGVYKGKNNRKMTWVEITSHGMYVHELPWAFCIICIVIVQIWILFLLLKCF
jgi:hypothetical protein